MPTPNHGDAAMASDSAQSTATFGCDSSSSDCNVAAPALAVLDLASSTAQSRVDGSGCAITEIQVSRVRRVLRSASSGSSAPQRASSLPSVKSKFRSGTNTQAIRSSAAGRVSSRQRGDNIISGERTEDQNEVAGGPRVAGTTSSDAPPNGASVPATDAGGPRVAGSVVGTLAVGVGGPRIAGDTAGSNGGELGGLPPGSGGSRVAGARGRSTQGQQGERMAGGGPRVAAMPSSALPHQHHGGSPIIEKAMEAIATKIAGSSSSSLINSNPTEAGAAVRPLVAMHQILC